MWLCVCASALYTIIRDQREPKWQNETVTECGTQQHYWHDNDAEGVVTEQTKIKRTEWKPMTMQKPIPFSLLFFPTDVVVVSFLRHLLCFSEPLFCSCFLLLLLNFPSSVFLLLAHCTCDCVECGNGGLFHMPPMLRVVVRSREHEKWT